MKRVNILGVNICDVTMKAALYQIEEAMSEKDKKFVIFTPNSEIINAADKDSKLKEVLNKADLLLPDGIGVIYASRILGSPIKERVAGFDTATEIIKVSAKSGYSIYILGAKPGVAEKAKNNLMEEHKGLNICGVRDGYFKEEDEPKIIADINNKKPDILFVCLGFPKQEFWIDKYKDKLNVKVMMGLGGSIDVFAKEAKRAPEFYQKYGLEWLYRLCKQPSRFVRMLALPIFAIKVILRR